MLRPCTQVCYFIEAGFYLQAIPYLLFIEQRRKDWAGTLAARALMSSLTLGRWSRVVSQPFALCRAAVRLLCLSVGRGARCKAATATPDR